MEVEQEQKISQTQEPEKIQLETEIKQAKTEISKTKTEAERVQREAEAASRKLAEENLRKQQEEQARQLEQQRIQQERAQQDLLSCNGKNWLPCPADQRLYCPPAGSAQCIIENTQTNSATSRLKICMEQAIEDHKKMAKRAKIDQEECEKEAASPLGSIACSIRHGPPSLSISHCTSGSGSFNEQPTYSPPPIYSPPDLQDHSVFNQARKDMDKIRQEQRLKDLEDAEFRRKVDCLSRGDSPCW